MLENDARQLAKAIARDFPNIQPGTDFIWTAPVAAKVVDCVLSLNRPYYRFVVPRVRQMTERFPETRSCAELLSLIGTFDSPACFAADVLACKDKSRAAVIVGVTEYLIETQARFKGRTEDVRLAAWAQWARPGDYLSLEVKYFGLAGFQYLRMLLGAETTKPDVHIERWVKEVLGRRLSPAHAVYALERAAELSGVSVRWLDVAIWSRGAGAPSAV